MTVRSKKIAQDVDFNWHYESGEYFTTGRKLVMQVYLNEEFEGGETEFLYYNKREKSRNRKCFNIPMRIYTHS